MKAWCERVCVAAGTAFGLGYAPVAPGTAGAVLGVGIFVAIALAAPPAAQPWLLAGALAAVCVLTVALSPWAERYWGKKDPGTYVLDEVAGFLVTVVLWRSPDLVLTCVWAFGVTRLLDILKPPPARQLEALPAGWGILADDVATSLMAAGVLHLGTGLLPALFGAA
jgi:phosphatidylglycerophosphatase A